MTIIILSAYDYSEIEAEAREAGVDEFIAKSLFRSRLTATLKNIIEGKSNKEANIETAENGKEAVEKFANAPMKEHIAKPWEMNRLCEIMQRYL